MHNFNLKFIYEFNRNLYICFNKNLNTHMFNQYIGDGANIFIAIVAVLVGFATALGYIDFLKSKKEGKKD